MILYTMGVISHWKGNKQWTKFEWQMAFFDHTQLWPFHLPFYNDDISFELFIYWLIEKILFTNISWIGLYLEHMCCLSYVYTLDKKAPTLYFYFFLFIQRPIPWRSPNNFFFVTFAHFWPRLIHSTIIKAKYRKKSRSLCKALIPFSSKPQQNQANKIKSYRKKIHFSIFIFFLSS